MEKAIEHGCGLAGYHQFEDQFGKYGSFELFWIEGWQISGWYWWVCRPGSLPDGEPHGPFGTSAEAYEDANQTGT